MSGALSSVEAGMKRQTVAGAAGGPLIWCSSFALAVRVAPLDIGCQACKPTYIPGAMGVMAAAVEDTDNSLRELNKDDYHSFLEAAGERLVVVDFYTDW